MCNKNNLPAKAYDFAIEFVELARKYKPKKVSTRFVFETCHGLEEGMTVSWEQGERGAQSEIKLFSESPRRISREAGEIQQAKESTSE